MTIRENVRAIALQIYIERSATQKPVTTNVKEKALRAIDGTFSDWSAYMTLFADSTKPQQLARLLPTEPDPSDPDVAKARKDARAYLAAAGTCTPDTVLNMENAVTNILDDGLQP
jgi:hypothetical protein